VETTFKHEVKFITTVPVEGIPEKNIPPTWKEETITKTATFKELSRTDPSQREMSWMIMDVFDTENVKKTKKGITSHINREIISELADKFVKDMLIIDENFSEQDKNELLGDNGAMIKLGLWLAHNKFFGFFLLLMSD
jgi:hypothetical protein